MQLYIIASVSMERLKLSWKHDSIDFLVCQMDNSVYSFVLKSLRILIILFAYPKWHNLGVIATLTLSSQLK